MQTVLEEEDMNPLVSAPWVDWDAAVDVQMSNAWNAASSCYWDNWQDGKTVLTRLKPAFNNVNIDTELSSFTFDL